MSLWVMLTPPSIGGAMVWNSHSTTQKVHHFITSMDIAVASIGVGQRFLQPFDKGEGLSSESIKIANGSELGGLGV